ARRLGASGGIGPLTLREVEERRKLSPAERRGREATLLRTAIPKGAVVVALDAKGRTFSSEEFSSRLEQWRDSGIADLAFVIGGADGLDPTLREGAQMTLSLGAMTWPHLLVRAMLAEQIYRAVSILHGHPYHRA
ncbi:MAG: 23S rRNA (pseudouridine(1915)-N(3))-methyltransferase RlmH, partial [Rhodospirillales bacterium]|nr:23S rRNA (pseudouridine(1915)-N(3))-methyltransferase RlmH [Rhodospirillales bacterium]